MVKSEAALAWGTHVRAHATHTNEALLLHGRSALGGARAILSAGETESTGCGTGAGLASMSGDGWRVLMLFCACGGLCVLVGKDANDACSDLVVDDGLVIFADDVDTKFLNKMREIMEEREEGAYYYIICLEFEWF